MLRIKNQRTARRARGEALWDAPPIRSPPKKRRNRARRRRGAQTAPAPKKPRNAMQTYGPMVARAATRYMTGGIGSLISGFGDYKIKSNTSMGIGSAVPMFRNNNGRFLFTKREFLKDILGTVDFTLHQFRLNPGLNETFPWLAQIAKAFEQWTLHGMVFEFVSTSSSNVLSATASIGLGTVVQATQYDPKDRPFISKFEMENYVGANSARPNKNQIHGVECLRGTSPINVLLTRDEEVVTASDLSFYDFGIFNLATVGFPSDGGVIGELWVSYDIELLKPKISNFLIGDARADFFSLVGATGARTLGASAPAIVSNDLLGEIDITGPGIYHFSDDLPNGTVVSLHYHLTGAAVNTTYPTPLLTGCTFVPRYGATGVAAIGTGVTAFEYDAIIRKTSSPAYITFGLSTLPTAATQAVLHLTLQPANVDLLVGEDDFDSRISSLESLFNTMKLALPTSIDRDVNVPII